MDILSLLLNMYLEVELLSHLATLCLIFWETPLLFFKAAALFCIVANSVGAFQNQDILANTCYYPFYCSHLSGYEVLCHRGFDLQFPNSSWKYHSLPTNTITNFIFSHVTFYLFCHIVTELQLLSHSLFPKQWPREDAVNFKMSCPKGVSPPSRIWKSAVKLQTPSVIDWILIWSTLSLLQAPDWKNQNPTVEK